MMRFAGRRLLIALCAAAVLVVGRGETASAHPAAPLAASAEREVEFSLTGLHCAACSVKIQKALRSMDGVADLREGRSKKHLIVKFSSKKTTPQALIDRIKEIGYGAQVVN